MWYMIEQILQNTVTMVLTQGRGQWKLQKKKKKTKNWIWKDISRNKPGLQKHSKLGSTGLTNLCSKYLDQEKMLQTANKFIKKNITSKFKGVIITQEKRNTSDELCLFLGAILYDGEFQIVIIQDNNIWIKIIYSK